MTDHIGQPAQQAATPDQVDSREQAAKQEHKGGVSQIRMSKQTHSCPCVEHVGSKHCTAEGSVSDHMSCLFFKRHFHRGTITEGPPLCLARA